MIGGRLGPYKEDTIVSGNCLSTMRQMPDGCVHMCVLSPPYWGLRDYNVMPQVWGGEAGCEHEWGDETLKKTGPTRDTGGGEYSGKDLGTRGKQGYSAAVALEISQGRSCRLCGAWRGNLGAEPTPQLYASHLVEILREVRRILRDDGTLWLNIGDSYVSNSPGQIYNEKLGGKRGHDPRKSGGIPYPANAQKGNFGLKAKDLVGIPWLVAFALRDDGWYLRRDIIWWKPNCKPESVTDRPTSAHEYLFLFSKEKRYYYDMDAIREPNCGKWPQSKMTREKRKALGMYDDAKTRIKATLGNQMAYRSPGGMGSNPKGRNKRSVWRVDSTLSEFLWFADQQGVDMSAFAAAFTGEETDQTNIWPINTKPFAGAHFASYPEALVEPCIRAGTSERGCCPKCGAPWKRMAENGWAPTCTCDAGEPIPCIVLDPFMGAGTTGVVAKRLERHYIGMDINQEYIRIANDRIAREDGIQLGFGI